jgi:hypothetical protein
MVRAFYSRPSIATPRSTHFVAIVSPEPRAQIVRVNLIFSQIDLNAEEFMMRLALSTVIGVCLLALTPFLAASDANAVVCARGVYRAGCAGPAGAVVVRRPPPVAVCRTVIVNGVAVRRCA